MWDADTAATFRGADLTPAQVRGAAESLTDGMDDDERSETYTDGDPIYSVCNGDTDADEIIDAATKE